MAGENFGSETLPDQKLGKSEGDNEKEKGETPEAIYTKAITEGGYIGAFTRDLRNVILGKEDAEGKEKEIFESAKGKIQKLEEAAEKLKLEEASGYYLDSVYAYLDQLCVNLDLAMEAFDSDEMKDEIIEIKKKRLEMTEKFIESNIENENFMAAKVEIGDWRKIKEELVIKETELGSEEQTEEFKKLKEIVEEKKSQLDQLEKARKEKVE